MTAPGLPDHLKFLELRIDELRLEADRQRQVAERVFSETSRMNEAAQRMVDDAGRLEREADAIYWALRLIAKVQRKPHVDPDLHAELLNGIPLELRPRERAILSALRDRSRNGIAEITWEELCRATSMGVKPLRDGLATLAQRGFIDPCRTGRGVQRSRYSLLKKGFGERRGVAA